MSVPNDFEGVVVERKQLQDKAAPSDPQVQGHNVEDADADVTDEGVMRVTAQFDEVAVWSHEVAVDSESDPYIKSIEEWLHVSEQVSAPANLEGARLTFDQIHSHSDNEPSARK